MNELGYSRDYKEKELAAHNPRAKENPALVKDDYQEIYI